MSKVRLTGSNSGYVEIAAAADAGNLTFIMPTTGTALFGNGNNVISGITTFNAAIDASSTVVFSNDVTFDGATAGYDVVWDRSDNQLEFADHTKISIGSGGDLQLYHDGNHSYIDDAGQGNLRLRSGTLEIQNLAGNKTSAIFSSGGGQTLNFNNSPKFVTTNTGVVVTGICTATSFSGDGSNLTGISSPLSFRNLIINGACMVAQRGTSSSSVGYQTVDRFKLGVGGANEVPQQYQGTLGSHESPYNEGFRYTYYIVNGDQTGGAGAGDYAEIQYKIESRDMATCGWNYTSASSYITLSFWLKSSVGQNFYGFVYSADGTAQRYIFQTGTVVQNSWNKIVVTIPGGTNVQFDCDVNEGFIIKWIPFYGTDKTNNSATPGSWANYNGAARCPDNTPTWWTTNNSTFFITGIQLEVGDTATTFEHRSFSDELRRCQRYFYKPLTSDGNIYGGRCGNNSTNTAVYYPVQMRDTPSIGGNARRGGGTSYVGKDYFNYQVSYDDNWWENFTADSEL